MSSTLPILTLASCRPCGACCQDVGVPPYRASELFGLPRRLRLWLLAKLAAIEGDPRRTPCIAYRGGCRIYRWRPAVCRDFEPGSGQCRMARHLHGVAA